MKKDFQFRSKRSVPIVLLLAAAAVGFCLSLPISGFGGKEELSVATPLRGNSFQATSSSKGIDLLKSQLDLERQETVKLEKELLDEKGVSQDRLRVVKRYRELAGMTDVTGQGIILTLSESKGTGGFEKEPGQFLIHQEDLLNIINELWYHGAEAISVGSPDGGKMERITTFSPIRCRGGVIEINDTEMFPPFEIRVVGEADKLKSVLERRGGYLANLKAYSIDSKIETYEAVFIPKYNGVAIWLYGRSLLGGVEDVIILDTGNEAEAGG